MAPFVGGLARGFPQGGRRGGEPSPSSLTKGRKTRAVQPTREDPYIVQSKYNRYARRAMK